MDLLAAGALMATLWREEIALAKWRSFGVGMMLGGALIFAALARLDHPFFHAGANSITFNIFGYSLVCIIASGLIAFSLGTERGLWLQFLTSKPIRWIGTISYTAYLVHAAALGLVRPSDSTVMNVCAAFVVTLTYASLSWILMEKPILTLRPAAWLKGEVRP
jgi:peptidoglycan/LPS O-acetylase OafA/YrhL